MDDDAEHSEEGKRQGQAPSSSSQVGNGTSGIRNSAFSSSPYSTQGSEAYSVSTADGISRDVFGRPLRIALVLLPETAAASSVVADIVDPVHKRLRVEPKTRSQGERKNKLRELLAVHSDQVQDTAALLDFVYQSSALHNPSIYKLLGDSSFGADAEVLVARDEFELLQLFLLVVRLWDPDILVGWEVQSMSLGYLLNRAQAIGFPLSNFLARVPEAPVDTS